MKIQKSVKVISIALIVIAAFKMIGPVHNLYLYYSSPIIDGYRVPYSANISDVKELIKTSKSYLQIYNDKRYLFLEYLSLFLSVVFISSCVGVLRYNNMARNILIIAGIIMVIVQQPLQWIFVSVVSGLNPLNILAMSVTSLFNLCIGLFLTIFFTRKNVKEPFKKGYPLTQQ